MMAEWVWLAIGALALFTLSALAGLMIAAILGSVSRNVSELLDVGPWSSAPLTRERLPSGGATAETRRLPSVGRHP
jgi:hypothetical protein